MLEIKAYVRPTGASPLPSLVCRPGQQCSPGRVGAPLRDWRRGILPTSGRWGKGVLEFRINFGPGYRSLLWDGRRRVDHPPGWRNKARPTATFGKPKRFGGNSNAERGRRYDDGPWHSVWRNCTRPARSDPEFRKGLLKAVQCYLDGEPGGVQDSPADYINGSIGFKGLAEMTGHSPKSLMRMLGPSGNPQSSNLCEILHKLQEHEGVRLEVPPSGRAASNVA